MPIRYVVSICCFLFVFVGGGSMQAQNVIVKTNLLGFLSGNYGAAAEIAAGKKVGILIGGNYVSTKQGDDTGFSVSTQETGYNISPEVRFYLSNRIDGGNLQGLFLGANLIYEKLNLRITNPMPDTTSVTGQATNFGYGAVIGHQWIFNRRFAVELFFNPYFNSPSITGNLTLQTPQPYEEKRGIQWRRIGVSVGIAF